MEIHNFDIILIRPLFLGKDKIFSLKFNEHFFTFFAHLTLIWVGRGGGGFYPPVGFPLITQKR